MRTPPPAIGRPRAAAATLAIHLAAAAGAVLVGGCSHAPVDLADRPCEAGRCASGYQCNPLTGMCVEPLRPDCTGGGLCPSQIGTGDACTQLGGFVPCVDGAEGCSRGCRVCSDGTWSACLATDCELGQLATCSTCGDDCTTRVAHAVPACLPAGGSFACDHEACDPGWADADGRRENGCECALHCAGKCGGPDGCGGTCPDTCVAPDTCGGGAPGVEGQCGCTPETTTAFCARLGKNCGTVTAPDNCGSVRTAGCPSGTAWGCTAPNTCGGGAPGVPNVCGCTPESDGAFCSRLGKDCGTVTAADACGVVRSVVCPAGTAGTCTPPDTCGGGAPGVPNVCGCTPETDAQFCARTGKDCGSVTEADNCGAPRTVVCPAGTAGTCTPPDKCGGLDGIPNVCGDWWSCAYAHRLPLAIAAGASPVPAGHSVSVTIDTSAALPGGDDVRVVWWSGTSWVELDRVLDPTSAWGIATSRLWFAVPVAIQGNGSLGTVYVYYGNAMPDAPAADETAVFELADFFDRADGPVGSPWTVVTGTDASGNPLSLTVSNHEMHFGTTGDVNQRPLARADFGPLTGLVDFRFGMDWTRTATGASPEMDYWVEMQIGDAATMVDPLTTTDTPTDGVGPSLEWGVYQQNGGGGSTYSHSGSGSYLHNRLASAVPGHSATVYDVSATEYTGPHDVEARIDVTSGTYDIVVDGSTEATAEPFLSTVTRLGRVRFASDSIDDGASVTGRAFDYVIVRKRLVSEPTVTPAAPETSPCTP